MSHLGCTCGHRKGLSGFGCLMHRTNLSGYGSGYGDTSVTDLLKEYAPTIQTAVDAITDPVQRAAVYKAQLQNAIARGASASEIRVLQAKLQAAQAAIRAKSAQQSSLSDLVGSGQVALFGVGAVFVAGAIVILSMGVRR